MFAFIKRQKGKFLYSAILRLNVFILSFSLIFSPSAAHAQSILNLPTLATFNHVFRLNALASISQGTMPLYVGKVQMEKIIV